MINEFQCPNLLIAVKDNPAAMAELQALLHAVAELSVRVKSLEGKIAKLSSNSRTSSKPPSSDRHNPNKPQPKSLRGSSGKRPGGQPGHEGYGLEKVAEPEEIVEHPLPENCPQCGHPLPAVEEMASGRVEIEGRQVIELEPARRRVVEHRAVSVRCPWCEAKVSAAFPEEVKAPVQYGRSVQAVVTYLSIWQLLPSHRLVTLMRDLCGCPMSAGSVSGMVRRAGLGALQVVPEIQERLLREPWVGFDETGLSVGGAMHWLHTASSPRWTVLHAHEKRGVEGISAGHILPHFQGRAVHDFLAAYMGFTQCSHALCNSHHLRDLRFVHEVLGQSWAAEMSGLLIEMKEAAEQRRAAGSVLSSEQLDHFQDRYIEILEIGYEQNPDPPPKAPHQRGKPARGKALNLLDRFATHAQTVFAFALQEGVPFDNNHAERDLRMMKVRQKISGCFRSQDLLLAFTAIRSVVSTAAKHALGAFHSIKVLLSPSPSLSAVLNPGGQGS